MITKEGIKLTVRFVSYIIHRDMSSVSQCCYGAIYRELLKRRGTRRSTKFRVEFGLHTRINICHEIM